MFNNLVTKNVNFYDNHTSAHTAIQHVIGVVGLVGTVGFVKFMNKRAENLR